MTSKILRLIVWTFSAGVLSYFSIAPPSFGGEAVPGQDSAEYRAGFNAGRASCADGKQRAPGGGSASFQSGFKDGCTSAANDFKSKNPAEEAQEAKKEEKGGCCG